MGITITCYQVLQVDKVAWESTAVRLGTPYYWGSFSLNTLLTLMIVARLVLRNKNLRNDMGIPTGINGFYTAVTTMFIESSALYAVAFLLFMGSWSAKSPSTDVFFPILVAAQVRPTPIFPTHD